MLVSAQLHPVLHCSAANTQTAVQGVLQKPEVKLEDDSSDTRLRITHKVSVAQKSNRDNLPSAWGHIAQDSYTRTHQPIRDSQGSEELQHE